MTVWYIIQCSPQAERKAASEIRRAGHRVYLPKISTIQVHRKTLEKLIRRRPLMPGYIFVRFADDAYRSLIDLQGVRGAVRGTSGQLATIPHMAVRAIMLAERAMKHEASEVRAYRMGLRRGRPRTLSRAIAEAMFAIGQSGLIVNGPFAEHECTVLSITDSGMVRASVTLIGRETPVELEPLTDIVPLARMREQA